MDRGQMEMAPHSHIHNSQFNNKRGQKFNYTPIIYKYQNLTDNTHIHD